MHMPMREYHPAETATTGFWQSIGVAARGEKLYEALHLGLPVSFLDRMVEVTGLSKKELGGYVSIAPATLQRRLRSSRFSTDESDRLYRLAQLVNAALGLFDGDQQAARHWLASPVRGLGNRKPVQMLQTSAQTTAVLDLIGRLEHGVVV